MTWFKVDDTLALHAKVLSAGNAAMGLWVRAGAWSMQQLTDGHVPNHVAGTLGTKTEAMRLVQAGLWLVAEGGYQFHQWTDVQRTKEQVEADRHAAAERQKRAREAALSRRESRRDSREESRTSHGVRHGPPDQTRPDQTRNSRDAYASQATEPDRFEEFWDTYSHKVGRAKAEKAYRVALKKPGVTADLLIASAAAYITWQMGEGKHPEFTKHPTTWLHGEHWRDERPARPAPQTNMQAHMALVRELAEREQSNVSPFRQLGGAS